MRSSAHPALPQPLSVWSPNRSNRHRNHTMSAAIQMKNQKDQRRTSPKSLVMASMAYLFRRTGRVDPKLRRVWQTQESPDLTRGRVRRPLPAPVLSTADAGDADAGPVAGDAGDVPD